MRNPIITVVALLLIILAAVMCVLFCCKGEDNTGTKEENSAPVDNPDSDSSDDDGFDFGESDSDLGGGALGEDLFNGDNIDPDGWTTID